MRNEIKGMLLLLGLVSFVGCGGGSSSSTVASTSDSVETALLKSFIVDKTLHEYDGFTYTKYNFQSNGNAEFFTYFDDEVYTTERPWSGQGDTSYTIKDGVFTLSYPSSTDVCTLENNTTTSINLKCTDAQNLIFWTTEAAAKANPLDRN